MTISKVKSFLEITQTCVKSDKPYLFNYGEERTKCCRKTKSSQGNRSSIKQWEMFDCKLLVHNQRDQTS